MLMSSFFAGLLFFGEFLWEFGTIFDDCVPDFVIMFFTHSLVIWAWGRGYFLKEAGLFPAANPVGF